MQRATVNGALLADRLRSAHTNWTRLRGLLGTRRLESGQGLWIKPCNQVHMALKTIRVRIKSVDEALDDAVDAMRAIQSKRKTPQRRGEYFENLEAVRAALTEKRLALVRLVRERKPSSVAELARLAKRDFKAVYRDVEALRGLGLVTIGPRRRGVSSALRSDATEIVLRIAV